MEKKPFKPKKVLDRHNRMINWANKMKSKKR